MTIDIAALRAGSRAVLARAITLVESRKPADEPAARALVNAILPFSGKAQRLGISGVPGVGKSTFIDAFGRYLIAQGHRVAVLAVDPSSGRSGGSILGDKTRMAGLAGDPRAYIRPSPSTGVLGGVARATREAMLLCEAAGFDWILIETVGTGQSEIEVADMVDFFLLLMLPGAGDELQGIKKGIIEIADMIAVNKADVDQRQAERAVRDYRTALHLLGTQDEAWSPPVEPCSAASGDGIAAIFTTIERHHRLTTASGWREERRRRQRLSWLKSMINWELSRQLSTHPDYDRQLSLLREAVQQDRLTPYDAARRLVAHCRGL